MRKFAYLSTAQRFADGALLLMRVFAGMFLIWNVWENITSAGHMQTYAGFLQDHGFPVHRLLAPLSIYLQAAIGAAFILGLFTRWAGLLCAIHFVIAIVMVDHQGGMRGIFPAGCLVVIGLYLATRGAGRFSFDEALRGNEVPRSVGSVRLRK